MILIRLDSDNLLDKDEYIFYMIGHGYIGDLEDSVLII